MWKMGEGEVGHWREKSKDFLYAEETMGIKTPERGDIGFYPSTPSHPILYYF